MITPKLDEFVQCFDEIKNAINVQQRQEILESHKSNCFVRFYCECCYNFYKTLGAKLTGISKAYCKGFSEDFDEEAYYLKLVDSYEKLTTRKITGNAAKDLLKELVVVLSPEVGDYMINAFNRKPVTGLGDVTVGKVYDDLKPAPGVMRCEGEPKNIKAGFIASQKLDALRAYIYYDDVIQDYVVRSRGQRLLNAHNFEYIINKLKYLGVLDESHVVDGEMGCQNWQDSISLTKTMSDLDDDKRAMLCFNVFDRVLKEDWFNNARKEKLSERLNQLEQLFDGKHDQFPVILVESVVVNSEEEAIKQSLDFIDNFKTYCHVEGAVVKDPDSYYGEDYSKSWIKVKPYQSSDLLIVGYTEGEGKLSGMLGAMILQLPDGSKVNCGTGYTDDERKEFFAKGDDLIGNYLEVKYLAGTNSGNIREPIFMRYREAYAGNKE